MQTIQNYGRFDEQLGCFEITAEPPKKWRNLHYNQWGPEEYYAEFTHVGDGSSRHRDDDTIPAAVSAGHAPS